MGKPVSTVINQIYKKPTMKKFKNKSKKYRSKQMDFDQVLIFSLPMYVPEGCCTKN